MKYNFNLFFLIQTFINTPVPQILFKISIKTIFILPDKKSLILVEGLLNIYQLKNIPQKWCWQLWYCRWETKECVVPHSRHPLGLRCLLVSQALKFTKKLISWTLSVLSLLFVEHQFLWFCVDTKKTQNQMFIEFRTMDIIWTGRVII